MKDIDKHCQRFWPIKFDLFSMVKLAIFILHKVKHVLYMLGHNAKKQDCHRMVWAYKLLKLKTILLLKWVWLVTALYHFFCEKMAEINFEYRKFTKQFLWCDRSLWLIRILVYNDKRHHWSTNTPAFKKLRSTNKGLSTVPSLRSIMSSTGIHVNALLFSKQINKAEGIVQDTRI